MPRQYTSGVSIANRRRPKGRRRKFPRDIQSPRFLSNLAAPIQGRSDTIVVYLSEWQDDDFGPAALIEFNRGVWRKISDERFDDSVGVVEKFQNQIWLQGQREGETAATLYVSRDKGSNWEPNNEDGTTQYKIDRDVSGRLWRAKQSQGFGPITFERDNSGTGNNWQFLSQSEKDYYYEEAPNGGPHSLACHPKNQNVAAVTVMDAQTDEPKVLITTDGSNFIETDPFLEFPLTFGVPGDIVFTPTGRLVASFAVFDFAFERTVLIPYSDPPYEEWFSLEDIHPEYLGSSFEYPVRMYCEPGGLLFFCTIREIPETSDVGLIVSMSEDNAQSWQEISYVDGPPFRLLPPPTGPFVVGEYIPGEPTGIFYDFDQLWLFFEPWGDAPQNVVLGLVWKWDGNTWTDEFEVIKQVSGLEVPVAEEATVSRINLPYILGG